MRASSFERRFTSYQQCRAAFSIAFILVAILLPSCIVSACSIGLYGLMILIVSPLSMVSNRVFLFEVSWFVVGSIIHHSPIVVDRGR